MNILVSACLLGVECRYDGKGVLDPAVKALLDRHFLIPVCPEDVTSSYQQGAQQALKRALLYGCRAAILKERSPSCGNGQIYDGTFTGKLTEGEGVCAGFLKSHGIKVYGESQIERLLEESERY